MAEEHTSWFNWFPMDGQTTISLTIGVVVTLFTFYYSIRKSYGAKEERRRQANFDLAGTITRRIAVEREQVSGQQFVGLRKAKAYKAAVATRELAHFEDILNLVMLEAVENHFLDKAAKSEILKLVEQSRATVSAERDDQDTDGGSQWVKVVSLGALSTAAGVAVAAIATWLGTWDRVVLPESSVIPVGLLVLIGLATMVFQEFRTLGRNRRVLRDYEKKLSETIRGKLAVDRDKT